MGDRAAWNRLRKDKEADGKGEDVESSGVVAGGGSEKDTVTNVDDNNNARLNCILCTIIIKESQSYSCCYLYLFRVYSSNASVAQIIRSRYSSGRLISPTQTKGCECA